MIFGEDTPITLGLAVGAAGGVGFIVWWVSSRLRKIEKAQSDGLRQIEKAQAAYELYAAQNYATKDGVKDALDRVFGAVDSLAQDMRERMGKFEEHWLRDKK